MKNIILVLVILTLSACVRLNLRGESAIKSQLRLEKRKNFFDTLKKGFHKLEEGAKKTWDKVEEGAKKDWEKVEKGAKKDWGKVEHFFEKGWNKTKDEAHKVEDWFKKEF